LVPDHELQVCPALGHLQACSPVPSQRLDPVGPEPGHPRSIEECHRIAVGLGDALERTVPGLQLLVREVWVEELRTALGAAGRPAADPDRWSVFGTPFVGLQHRVRHVHRLITWTPQRPSVTELAAFLHEGGAVLDQMQVLRSRIRDCVLDGEQDATRRAEALHRLDAESDQLEDLRESVALALRLLVD
jgi:hypothetical protein